MMYFIKNYIRSLPSFKNILIVISVSIAYLILINNFIGIKQEHILTLLVFNICYFISVATRKFILAFSIFILYGIIYDLMKIFPNYEFKAIDILNIYQFEKRFFGIHFNNTIITLNEYFDLNHSKLLDILAGLFYINWVPIPLAFAFFLYFKNKEQFLSFSIAFFLVNIIGFILYYVHPAAPPWYLKEYGNIVNTQVMGSPAGLSRFDELIHFPLFTSIYSRNSNIFAAFPSLHSAYPVIVLYYSIRNKNRFLNWIFGVFMLGIWFTAIYSGHHYVTDIIAGIICAVFTIILFQLIISRITIFKQFLKKYLNEIR